RLHRDAEIRASDVAARQECVYDAIDGDIRDCQRCAAGERRTVDAEHRAIGVDERAAGESVVDGEVQPNESVDLTPAPRPPLVADGADDAEAGADAVVAGPTDGQHETADSQRVTARAIGD